MTGEDRVITRVEALRSLRIGPRLFRQLAEEYRSELGPLPLGGLTDRQLETMRGILRLRALGTPKDAIRAELEAGAASDAMGAPLSKGLPSGEGDALLRIVTAELQKAEERRAEDRDRLLNALIRTQQEIAHLRQELAASKSRRDRKKDGFFRRLFG